MILRVRYEGYVGLHLGGILCRGATKRPVSLYLRGLAGR